MKECDYKKLYELTSDIYKIGLDWSAWEGVLEYFASYVKNGKGSITVRQNSTFEIDIDNFYLTKTWNLGSESIDPYRRYLYKHDVWASLEYNNTEGKLCVFSDHLPKRELLQTRFYKEWLDPIGISDGVAIQLFETKKIRIVFKIFHDDNTEAVLDLCRDIEKVYPHLCKATEIHMKILGIGNGVDYQTQANQLKEKYGLTPKEIEVATASVYLGTNKKIAESLGVNESTIKKHIKSILKKMNLSQKDEITHKLICFINPQLELIPPNPMCSGEINS
ncbi:helix-turn-helix transcriptional regulator [Leucothrix arctica]|uniref:HTH luxR-type domain-containing protein n=1 Tax=Leucothrix arctica TaxID=1481894 RepID=A0A317C605_9GAMM|nr:helix-turn-helix transcriptional regulator [Leucothrix arctica]PWQ94095.1 hypothetical protein DKT75_16275 [Leucothrix arctica]